MSPAPGPAPFDPFLARAGDLLAALPAYRTGGRVVGANGLLVRIRGLELGVGQAVELVAGPGRDPVPAEVVGMDGDCLLAMPYGGVEGLGPRSVAFPCARSASVPVGPAMLGRVIDGLGRPLDGRPLPGPEVPRRSVRQAAPGAVERPPVTRPLPLGVRVLDSVLTCAEGGRLGLFAAAGVGKSTLLTMIAKRARADAVVVCLVGERSREASELVSELARPGGPPLSFVVSTSSDPALARARAPLVAQTLAEGLRDAGHHVLLLVDSLTRYAQALREIGLARGEAPAARGFPPSALAGLAPLLERAGPAPHGTITGLYTVLVEGNDPDEPVADAARSYLDGHIELSRSLARAGIYPPIDPARSLSRLAARVVPPARHEAAARFRALWARYDENRDLIAVGAHKKGCDPALDAAIAARPRLERFVAQAPGEEVDFDGAFGAMERCLEGV